MKTKILFTAVLAFIMLFNATAQKNNRKITITGKVTDVYSSAVVGALIMVDGKTTTTKSNNNGYYKIRVKPSVKQIGVFTTLEGVKEEAVNGRTVINFTLDKMFLLQPGEGGGSQDIINDGYGNTRKDALTKPVTKSDVSDNKYASFSTIYDVLNTLPGVTVSGSNVTVRGIQTMGSNTPLFVVDGVTVSSISQINPSMVKSIEVLKGPAASIYGLQGANGVILIHTRTGK